MGSSAKKKKEKKKDFQKTKLKVGKTKAKASNFTDTSFKSKAIVLQQQLAEEAPDQKARFEHSLSLAHSKSESQRRDALASLTGQLSTTPPYNPVGPEALLDNLLPLMTDISGPVRSQLLKLLKALPPHQIKPLVGKAMLNIRRAMTHISQEIKGDGLNYLEWLLEVAGDEVVCAADCWVKPLKAFMSLLGWTMPTIGGSGQGKWTSAPRTTFGAKKHGQSFPRQMTVLAQFLRCAFKSPEPMPWIPSQYWETFSRVPKVSNPYGYINLFGLPRDEDSEMYQEKQDRQYIFEKRFGEAMRTGVEMAKKEGGQAGRAAAVLDKVIRDGMSDYEYFDRFEGDDKLWEGYIM